MNSFIIYQECPVCHSKNIKEVLKTKDYTVSGEIFSIWHCKDCGVRFTQNVPDAESIGTYYQSSEYISHSDTKKGFINRLYHIVRNYTLQGKQRLIEKAGGKQKGSLLDVGAGTGGFAYIMRRSGWSVTGLEPDAVARQNALKNYDLHLQTPDALFTLPEKEFDVITLWHVLEHIHYLHQYLQTFERILKDDGIVVIAVPNYTSYDAGIYQEYWAAYDVPRHLYHFSRESMRRLVQQHGFHIIRHKPMWFDSFYVSILSEQYKTGSNNMVKAVWNGMLSNIHAMRNAKRCSSVIYIIKKHQS